MDKWRMTIVALSLAAILSVPMFGIALAAPATNVVANEQKGTADALTVELLPPLENRSTWYGGAVIPIRVVVLDENDTALANVNVTVWVNGVPGTSPGHSFMGNKMMNTHDGVYQFNLETKPYPAGPGSDPIVIRVLAIAANHDDRTGEVLISVALN